uniref:ATP synthase F0 subunit 8 n=1 Tax=Acropyga guianensis TaxID=602208 RepID=A0A6G5NID3_9HYME|nr:ATP synthase F0 subunit 8 [Acropyga guianensis]QBG38621.1 ATP synthase F0 subunit 8 [Acropyga guianensis]
MPHMSPMMWMLILYFTLVILLMIMNMMYFKIIFNLKIKTILIDKFKWMWKW